MIYQPLVRYNSECLQLCAEICRTTRVCSRGSCR